MVIITNSLTALEISKIIGVKKTYIYYAIKLGQSKYKNKFSVEIPQTKDGSYIDTDIEQFRRFFETVKNNEQEKQIWKWWVQEVNEMGKRNKETLNK